MRKVLSSDELVRLIVDHLAKLDGEDARWLIMDMFDFL